MRFLIFKSFGPAIFPKALLNAAPGLIELPYPQNRGCKEALDYIDSLSPVDNLGDAILALTQRKIDHFVHISKKATYFFFREGSNVSFYQIEDVDTSRLWTIMVYDGAETVRYLDNFKVEDEKINFVKDFF